MRSRKTYKASDTMRECWEEIIFPQAAAWAEAEPELAQA